MVASLFVIACRCESVARASTRDVSGFVSGLSQLLVSWRMASGLPVSAWHCLLVWGRFGLRCLLWMAMLVLGGAATAIPIRRRFASSYVVAPCPRVLLYSAYVQSCFLRTFNLCRNCIFNVFFLCLIAPAVLGL